MMHRTVSRIFRDLTPPSPPPDLRRRVLSAASGAPRHRSSVSSRARRSLVDRCWESRGLRLAWVLTVVLLLVANAGVDTVGSSADLETSTNVRPAVPKGSVQAARNDARTLRSGREAIYRGWLEDASDPATRTSWRVGS